MRPIERKGAVAIEAELVGGLAELGVIFSAVNVVTGEAGDASAIHEALHEIVSLHAVFVGAAVREVIEGGSAEGMFFELPIITKI